MKDQRKEGYMSEVLLDRGQMEYVSEYKNPEDLYNELVSKLKKYSIQIARSTEEEAASAEEISKPVSVEAENTRPAMSDTLTAGDAW